VLCHLNSGKARGFRRVILILRTAYWYAWLSSETGKETPYALGKFALPNSHGKKDGIAFNDNSWPKYLAGTLVPKETRLALVEEKARGSRAAYWHGLFEALDVSVMIGARGDELLRKLHPGVQRAVFVNDALARGECKRRQSISQILIWLERHCDLDALAAAIFLLREAVEQGKHALAFRIAVSVYRLLLASSVSGLGYLIRAELAVIVMHRILPLAKSNGRVYVPDVARFEGSSKILRQLLRRLSDPTRKDQATVRRRLICALLEGRYGEDLLFGFRATTALDAALPEWPVESQIEIYTASRYERWALEVMSSFRDERSVPRMVITEVQSGGRAIKRRNDPYAYPPELVPMSHPSVLDALAFVELPSQERSTKFDQGAVTSVLAASPRAGDASYALAAAA
jgi:hypothetical protein